MKTFVQNRMHFVIASLLVMISITSSAQTDIDGDSVMMEKNTLCTMVTTIRPPGPPSTSSQKFCHWNQIAAEDFVKQNFSEMRWARSMALLNMAMADAAVACWDAKFTFFNPSPSQVDPSIKVITGLPNFPSYISGHSTFSAAAAVTFSHIIPARSSAYDAMMQEAAISSLHGAIHYRSDIEVGVTVGKKIGAYAVQRATTDGAE